MSEPEKSQPEPSGEPLGGRMRVPEEWEMRVYRAWGLVDRVAWTAMLLGGATVAVLLLSREWRRLHSGE